MVIVSPFCKAHSFFFLSNDNSQNNVIWFLELTLVDFLYSCLLTFIADPEVAWLQAHSMGTASQSSATHCRTSAFT